MIFFGRGRPRGSGALRIPSVEVEWNKASIGAGR